MSCIIEIRDSEINELLYFFNFEENNGSVCKFKLIDVRKFTDFFFYVAWIQHLLRNLLKQIRYKR